MPQQKPEQTLKKIKKSLIKIASAESNTVSTTTGGALEEERKGDIIDEDEAMKEKLLDLERFVAEDSPAPSGKVHRASTHKTSTTKKDMTINESKQKRKLLIRSRTTQESVDQ